MRLRSGSLTDIGMVRETNQDSVLAAAPLFAVADGMGGHQGGEVASATALDVLEATFGNSATPNGLLEAVRRANAKVWDKAQLDEQLRGMGTTLTAAALVTDEETGEEKFMITNVGDSRTYMMRNDVFEQVTQDHSFVGEMVRAGEISAEEAEVHPKRNIVTRALGVEPTVEVDSKLIDPQPGDRYLLCSDGLTREVGDDQIAAVLRRLRNPDEAVRELVNMAKHHGGHDNITIIVIDVEEDGQPATASPAVAAQPEKKAKKQKAKKTKAHGRRSGFTFRTFLFFVAILALIAAGIGSVVWYARATYYVGLEGEQLVIYRGRPEPVLFFKPTVDQRTNVLTSDVPASARQPLTTGVTFGSLDGAQNYITNLQAEAAAAQAAANPEPVATTVPPARTTSRAR